MNALLVFAIALLVRLYHLNIPFLEPYNNLTRQVVCGMIARNFYRHGFNFLYPELDQGAGPYLFNAEMPIGPYLMALVYRILGGVQEWGARAVSVAFSMGMLILLYSFVRRVYGERHAFWATLFASLSPLSVAFSRSIQPDIIMLFASVGGLYAFYLFLEEKKWVYYFSSMAMIFLAFATKIYTLYLFLPLLVLALMVEGKKTFFNPKYTVYALVTLLALGWYAHMWRQGQIQHLYYDTIRYNRGEAFSPANLLVFFKMLFIHLLTPVGSVFFLIGLFKRSGKKEDIFFYAWLASVFLFLAVTWRIVIRNPYYELALVPVCAVFVGRGIVVFFENERWRFLSRNPLCLAFLTAAVMTSLFYFYRGLYWIPQDRRVLVDAGKMVASCTAPDDLVIASYGGSPAFLYYCDRKGWEFDLSRPQETLAEELEQLRAAGARYFVTTRKNLSAAHAGAFEEYLRSRYTVLVETDDYVAWKIQTFS